MCSSHWPQNPSGKTVREADCRCRIPTSLWDQTDSTVFFLKFFFSSFVSFLFFFLNLLIQLVESWWSDDFQSSLECLCCTWLGSVDFAFILILKKSIFFSFTSETRLVEIMEGLCDESASEVCFWRKFYFFMSLFGLYFQWFLLIIDWHYLLSS